MGSIEEHAQFDPRAGLIDIADVVGKHRRLREICPSAAEKRFDTVKIRIWEMLTFAFARDWDYPALLLAFGRAALASNKNRAVYPTSVTEHVYLVLSKRLIN